MYYDSLVSLIDIKEMGTFGPKTEILNMVIEDENLWTENIQRITRIRAYSFHPVEVQDVPNHTKSYANRARNFLNQT